MLNSQSLYKRIIIWREEKGWSEKNYVRCPTFRIVLFNSWTMRWTMLKSDTLVGLYFALENHWWRSYLM